MGDFRDAQNQAHPNKTNTLMVGILFLLISILGIQIWLLYSALNNALEDSRLHVIPKAAHLSNMERPQEFNKILIEFLGSA